MSNTGIEWTDSTWSPVTGCTKISTGCRSCYAERMSKRLAGRFGYPQAPDNFKVTLHEDRLNIPASWKKPKMIFVCSMSDLFHEKVPFKFIDEIFAVMVSNPHHTFQVLTKRPERMKEYFDEREDFIPIIHNKYLHTQPYPYDTVNDYYDSGNWCGWYEIQFPDNCLDHIWLGISAENQEQADKRIPILLQIPAAVRFVSVEPMIGQVNLKRIVLEKSDSPEAGKPDVSIDSLSGWYGGYNLEKTKLDWVICGSESSYGARPMDPDWARDLRDQCKEANVPFFMKQLNIDGKLIKNINDFPEDLKIRKYPDHR